jgi:hypothetical protein
MESLLFPPPPPEGARSGFDQGEWWQDATGHWHKIDEMSLGHVENVMAMLMRKAPSYAYALAMRIENRFMDAPDDVFEQAMRDSRMVLASPDATMKATPLYRALKKRRKKLRKELKKTAKAHAEKNARGEETVHVA